MTAKGWGLIGSAIAATLVGSIAAVNTLRAPASEAAVMPVVQIAPASDLAGVRDDLHELSNDVHDIARGQHALEGRLSNIEGYLQGQREAAEARRGR